MTEQDDLFDGELQAVLDAMPLVFFQKDVENRIVRTNRAAAESLGTSVDSLLGTATSDWFPDADIYQKRNTEVMRSGRPVIDLLEQTPSFGSPKAWIRKDVWPHHASDGSIDGVLVFVHDATAEATTEEALSRSEAHLRAILASEPECVKVLDTEGRVVEMNPAGLRMVEADALVDVAGVSVYDFLLPAYHDAHRDLHRQVLEGHSGRMEYEIVGLRGSQRWIETHAAPLPSGEHSFLAVSRDITERKRSESERESLRAQLRHVQRLEGIGLLAGGVAHDFNNHLMVISGRVEIALADLDEEHPARRHLETVLTTSRQAANVCDQLLTYAGKRTLDREPADLSRLVAAMDALLRVTVSKRADLRLDLQEDLPAVIVDRVQLSQVIVNLVSNASDALEGGHGTITIRTGIEDRERVWLAAPMPSISAEAGPYVFVSVTDTGTGVAPELVEQIFDPFFTTKEDGRGLGLATALGTVRSHRGAIDIDSTPGHGTTISAHFPATSHDAVSPSVAGETSEPAPSASKAVLVVDDEEPVRTVLAATLVRHGFEVLEASSGPDAIESLRSDPAAVDAVVLDMTMPDMDGSETYAELARLDPELPVLFSSGYARQDVMDWLDSLDHVAFIQKPYSGAELVQALRSLFAVGHRGRPD